MKLITKVLSLVEKVNKISSSAVSARFHMTRHELKVQVFDNAYLREPRPIDAKIRYFQKNEVAMLELIQELEEFIKGLK